MPAANTPDGISFERPLRLASIALSGGFILLFLYVALHRLHYPFELDRMESSMMTSIWRLAHDLPLYGKPSMEWVSFLYAPFYFYCSAFAARFMGLSYAAPRLVSIPLPKLPGGAIAKESSSTKTGRSPARRSRCATRCAMSPSPLACRSLMR